MKNKKTISITGNMGFIGTVLEKKDLLMDITRLLMTS